MPETTNISKFSSYGGTLCWKCKRLDCSWMQSLIPVRGWTAIKSYISFTVKGKQHIKRSYRVTDCLLFEKPEVKNNA